MQGKISYEIKQSAKIKKRLKKIKNHRRKAVMESSLQSLDEEGVVENELEENEN